MTAPLYKTTIVIWSEYDPTGLDELADLAQAAVDGDAYCSSAQTVEVVNPPADPDWDGTEFFAFEMDNYPKRTEA